MDSISQKEKINYDFEILQERLNNVDENITKYNHFKCLALTDYASNYISKEDYEEYNEEYSNKIKNF